MLCSIYMAISEMIVGDVYVNTRTTDQELVSLIFTKVEESYREEGLHTIRRRTAKLWPFRRPFTDRTHERISLGRQENETCCTINVGRKRWPQKKKEI